MATGARTYFGVGFGALMVGLGLFVALRLMATGGRPLTGATWLDLVFALFFLVRGGLYLWNARPRPPGN